MKRIWIVVYHQENTGQCIMGAYDNEVHAREYIDGTPLSAASGESYSLQNTFLYETNRPEEE